MVPSPEINKAKWPVNKVSKVAPQEAAASEGASVETEVASEEVSVEIEVDVSNICY